MKTRASSISHPENAGGLFTSLISISLLLTLLTLVLSAYIRLAQSGLDCSAWPDCYGQIGVNAEQQGIAVLTQAGAEMPHKGARVAHRLIASTLGITVALILLLSIKRKMQGQPGLFAAILLLLATVFLATLGYYTPSRTMPWVTLGNLGGGMLMAALLWWLGQRSVSLHPSSIESAIKSPIKKTMGSVWPLLALCLLSIQILSGAWVSANFAATACSSSLFCEGFSLSEARLTDSFSLLRELTINAQGSILPPEQLAQTISLTHRVFALFCLVYLAVFALRIQGISQPLSATAKGITLFLTLQLLLGVVSVYYQLPLALVSLHNLLAALLLLCLVNALHHLYPQR